MLWIIHTLIGIIIGLLFNNPFIIIPVAFLSHFIFDAIPHWDGDFDKKRFEKTGIAKIKKSVFIIRTIDMIFSMLLLAYFFYITKNNYLLLGVFFSLLPDFIKIGYYGIINKIKFFKDYLIFHSKIQKETSILKGLIIQIIFFLLLIWIIYQLI
jgi:hypothetical protein